MAGPTADLLQLIKERRFEHAGNPILRFAADNTVVEQDAIGRWRPSKRKARKRIDPIVAAIMALDRAERALFGPPADDEGTVELYDEGVQISPRI
jgi:phage terminase large subunit-like protein